MLRRRDPQTEVKHEILEAYLDHWTGIIINGVAGRARSFGSSFRRRFVYVDGFSFQGRYMGDTEDVLLDRRVLEPTWGSPIRGIKKLDQARTFAAQRGLQIETIAILFEKDKGYFETLRESLDMAGLGDRLRINPRCIDPHDRAIFVLNDDFLKYVDVTLELVNDRYSNAFFLLDPWGPKGIPYETVRRIISHERVDVMINLMYQDLHKKQGTLVRESDSPALETIIRNYDAMFGTTEWQDIANKWRHDTKHMEFELSSFYLGRLQVADSTLAVKHIRLEFPDRDRTMFYLFLTTHDPTGALVLNEILYDAKLTERVLKWNYQQAKWVHKTREKGQLVFEEVAGFNAPPVDGGRQRSVDRQGLATAIHEFFHGHSHVTRRAIYRFLANSDVFTQDIDAALTLLKRRGLARYENSRLDTPIYFTKEQ